MVSAHHATKQKNAPKATDRQQQQQQQQQQQSYPITTSEFFALDILCVFAVSAFPRGREIKGGGNLASDKSTTTTATALAMVVAVKGTLTSALKRAPPPTTHTIHKCCHVYHVRSPKNIIFRVAKRQASRCSDFFFD
jgi:hypothetical protein